MNKLNKKKIIAIIQARTTSTRLPNKVLMDIEGRPMLFRVIERVKAVRKLDDIVLAIPDSKENDSLEEFCRKNNLKYFRGSENDVLRRYYEAAKNFQADIVVRITSDCPLVDPEVIDLAIEKHLNSSADYTSSILERTFPRGLDTEVFNYKTLEKAFEEAKEPHQREHVTPYIYEHPEIFELQNVLAEKEISWPDLRLTVDTKEDMELIREIYKRLYKSGKIFLTKEVVDLLNNSPELIKINADIQQKPIK